MCGKVSSGLHFQMTSPVLRPPDAKTRLIGKDPGAGKD